MKTTTFKFGIILAHAVFVCVTAVSALGQIASADPVIAPYTPNPTPGLVARSKRSDIDTGRTVTAPDRDIKTSAVHPSTIYRIGSGDLLKIDLKNSIIGVHHVKVRADGCIDFQLAGEGVCVAGSTVDEAAAMLRRAIKLFADPQISVEVREFASHVITISGYVEQPGQQQIQRDAVPFFVVRAGVVLNSAARSVRVIRNASERAESFDLTDANLGDLYIFPGDTVEFL